jgi:hypothetical protein
MKKQITRIAPLQAAKIFALIYFVVGLVVAIPLGLLSMFVPAEPGSEQPGVGFFLALPVLYALASFIFIPLGCWLYNVASKYVGGVEITVKDLGDA